MGKGLLERAPPDVTSGSLPADPATTTNKSFQAALNQPEARASVGHSTVQKDTDKGAPKVDKSLQHEPVDVGTIVGAQESTPSSSGVDGLVLSTR